MKFKYSIIFQYSKLPVVCHIVSRQTSYSSSSSIYIIETRLKITKELNNFFPKPEHFFFFFFFLSSFSHLLFSHWFLSKSFQIGAAETSQEARHGGKTFRYSMLVGRSQSEWVLTTVSRILWCWGKQPCCPVCL